MIQRHQTAMAVILCAAALTFSRAAYAAPPQVPALPTQTAGYVKYAITDLPSQYNDPAITATNNTPADNPLTDAGATLGRVLFYDNRLSGNNTVSCSSCHHQSNGFSDSAQFSAGINGQLTGRHSMALANSTYYADGKAFWDERAASLEAQALVPIQSPSEMGSTLTDVVTKLGQTAYYPVLFQAAFGTPDVTPDRISKAIAQFERSMVSYNSKLDDSLTGKQTLNAMESQGQQLFNGAGRCSQCHTTNAQVSDSVHNIGLDATVIDAGAGDGKFKAPSLRNVAVRGRFMHDGRFQSLAQVIQFYSTGVQNSANLDPIMQSPLQLALNAQQISSLLAYLSTLTDNTFLTSSLFSNPFATLPGDYNGDGLVDGADYQVWRSNFGNTTSLSADGNGDGVIDTADYVLWRDNQGRTWQSLATGSGSGLAGSAVPEPAVMTLAMTAVGAAFALRRRRKRG